MNYTMGTLLSFLVASQLLFVALYLFTHKKGNKRNNSLLAIVFLMFSLSLMDFTFRNTGLILPFPLLHLLDDGFFFLYGPVIFFYVQGVVYQDFSLQPQHIFHLIPYMAYTGLMVVQLILIDPTVQADVTNKVDNAELPVWIYIVTIFFYMHILIYMRFSWRTLITYQTVIKRQYSSVDTINLDWLNFLVKAFIAITIVALVHNMTPMLQSKFFQFTSLLFLLVATLFFINRVVVKALNQPAIFSGISSSETAKYSSSNLSLDQLNIHKNQLEEIMAEKKLYLQTDLMIQDLASELNTTTKTLSQVINQCFNKSFFDYVNTYRCEHVKKILKDSDEKLTILEAMYQSGFNSKSSFNKEFKKLTGQTPSSFKKSLSVRITDQIN